MVANISRALEGHLGLRQEQPEWTVACCSFNYDTMTKGKPLERREGNPSHSPTGEEAFTVAWGAGSGFPGPVIKEEARRRVALSSWAV